MTPKAQRIAIATACPKLFRVMEKSKDLCWKPPGMEYEQDADPLSDLNACHEMEKTLTDEQQGYYWDHLKDMTDEGFNQLHATASEKCEAFLRTLGLWEDAQ
mgnify:CR=1 FL=1